MNAELNAVLRLLGVDGLEEPGAWRRVSMVLNHGAVPARAGMPAWGFKLLILDEEGRPEWFARCSWTQLNEMLRETALLEVLTQDPVGREHVPELRTGYTDRLFVQLNRHLGSRAYGSTLSRIGSARWASDVTEIITIAERVMERATLLMPSLRTQRTADERQASVRADLARVAAAGVSTRAMERVSAVLEQVHALPFVLQHGDLWPSNVIRSDDRWWLIDFAECGFVWVPLYDAFHMLHHAAPSATQPWYALAGEVRADEWTAERWKLTRAIAARHRLSASDVGVSLVFYLVHLTAYRLRPGVPLIWSSELLRTIEQVGEFLGSGRSAADLIPGLSTDHAP